MEQQNQAILTTELSEQITACTFSKADLQTLCQILQESSHNAAEEEISYYNPIDRPPEQVLAERELLRLGFELKVTVRGIDDETVFGTIPVVFNSPRFPDKVKSLYINSALDLRNLYNWFPRNHFELLLDFAKPKFNLSLSPSGSTPNASNILVSGRNETWVIKLPSTIPKPLPVQPPRNESQREFSPFFCLYQILPFPRKTMKTMKLPNISQ